MLVPHISCVCTISPVLQTKSLATDTAFFYTPMRKNQPQEDAHAFLLQLSCTGDRAWSRISIGASRKQTGTCIEHGMRIRELSRPAHLHKRICEEWRSHQGWVRHFDQIDRRLCSSLALAYSE